jgi:hypothetical protein
MRRRRRGRSDRQRLGRHGRGVGGVVGAAAREFEPRDVAEPGKVRERREAVEEVGQLPAP